MPKTRRMPPKATLCVFAYGGITASTHACVVRDIRRWPSLVHMTVGEEADIGRNRGRVATHFLDEGADRYGDVLLMIDRDIIWEPGDLELIASACAERKGVVGGIYPFRSEKKGVPFVFMNGTPETGRKLIDAKYLSAGFMAAHRGTLEAIADDTPRTKNGFIPFFLQSMVDGMYLSEDWAFCARVAATGDPVLAHCEPRLQHEGTYRYRLED